MWSAVLVRDASDAVRSECARVGSPICLRLCSSWFGIALYGALVNNWSALCSCKSVSLSGCTYEAFQARVGNAYVLYRGIDAPRPRERERTWDTEA